jgi:hypothetical protein
LAARGPLALIGDNEIMICPHCRRREHQACKGGTWCDCQHKPPADLQPEPVMGWIRQG